MRLLRSLAMTAIGSLLVFSVVGCGKREAPPAAPASEVPASVVDLSATGSLKGRVFYEGAALAPRELPVRGNPECAVFHKDGKILSEELLVKDGGLENAFVYVKEGLEGRAFAPPPWPMVIQNKNCLYVPHVAGVQVGQPVVLLNNDPTLHNIHSYAKNSPAWNLGLPFQGVKQTKKFQAPEVMVTLKCDVHPWMLGYVGVLPHPYFAVSQKDGHFEINNLPPGEYLIEAWHEKLGAQSQRIKIGPRETKEVEFKFGG